MIQQTTDQDELIEAIVKLVGTGPPLLNILQKFYTADPASQPVLSIPIDLDLTHITQTYRKLAAFILYDYPNFLTFLNRTVFDIAEFNIKAQKNRALLEKLSCYNPSSINCSVHFSSCPVPRRNFLNSEYLRDKLEQRQGVVIYLKEALIVSVKQQELFLWGWSQTWSDCLCSSRQQTVCNYQTFFDVARSGKFKEKRMVQGSNTLGEKRRCSICEADFRSCTVSDEAYLPCQRITICCGLREGKSKQQLFQPSIFHAYVSSDKVGTLKVGEVYDLCCLNYTSHKIKSPLIVNNTAPNRIKCELNSTIICICSYPSLSHTNTHFFSALSNVRIRYKRPLKSKQSRVSQLSESLSSKRSDSSSIRGYNNQSQVVEEYDVNKLYDNYTQLLEGINEVEFPYCRKNCFTLLKLGVLASVFYKHRNHILEQYKHLSPDPNQKSAICKDVQGTSSVNLMVLSDQQHLVSKIMQLKHLKIKHWPLHYDSVTIGSFVVSCFNSIVLFVNPTKKDLPYLSQLLQSKVTNPQDPTGSKIPNVNVTVWTVLNPELLKSYNKQFPTDKFDIILDVTFLNNNQNRQVEHDISSVVDSFLQGFIENRRNENGFFCNQHDIETAVRRRKYRDLDDQAQGLPNNPLNQTVAVPNDSQEAAASEILEQYYIRSRQHKQTSLRNFISLEKTAYSMSLIRSMFSSTRLSLSVSDILLAVFLEEETSRNRKGNQNTLFANDVAKFLLNETDRVSVMEYDYEKLMGGIKSNIPKKEVFTKIISEIALLINPE